MEGVLEDVGDFFVCVPGRRQAGRKISCTILGRSFIMITGVQNFLLDSAA